jgi:Zn-dependent peptidase ImmA (M78 family)
MMDKHSKLVFYTFIKFVKDELKITRPFNVMISSDREKFTTYAYYDRNTTTIAVYVGKRALADVMRSAAHELVHHLQFQRGDLEAKTVQDVGGTIEDEANAVAGQLIKKFGKLHKDFNIYTL